MSYLALIKQLKENYSPIYNNIYKRLNQSIMTEKSGKYKDAKTKTMQLVLKKIYMEMMWAPASQCPWCCACDEQIHMDCGSPVEKKGQHGHSE